MTDIKNNRYVYDIEIMGGNFFCITFLNIDTEEFTVFTIYNKTNDLLKLEKFLSEEKTLIGYNNIDYDGIVLQYLLQNKKSKTLLQDIFEFSTDLIHSERGFGGFKFNKYKYPEIPPSYKQIDLMKIIEVNGNVPSLKLAGIILHWHKVQDLPYEYDHVVANQEECNTIIEYNKNDVLITLNLYKKLLPQIEFREKLGELYNLNLINCSDSKIGDELLKKFYTEKTGISNVYSLKDKVIEHEQFYLKDCIFPDVQFQTNYLKRVKRELEDTLVRKSTNYGMKKLVCFGGVEYQFASGGLHSIDTPALFKSNEEYELIDCDLASYYPSMMIKNNIIPEHLGKEFIEIVEDITKERIKAKKKDKIKAQGLKITVNSIYGKLGFPGGWFRDNRALLKVTISGQLYLLMLIEDFVLAGIDVISANTDGIVCRIHKSILDKYYQLANDFSKKIGIGIEFTHYNLYARRDVNNYLSRKDDGEVKYKGCYTPEPEIKKGYMYPIVPKAVYKYLLEDIPFEQTIKDHNNVLDFCVSKKMGAGFEAEYHFNDIIEPLQKTNRFYISNSGGKLIKKNKEKGSEIGLFVENNVIILNDYNSKKEIKQYDINYDFYVEEARKLVDDLKLYDKEFESFVDEDENFIPSENNKKREDYFYQFRKIKGLPEKFIDNLMWLEDNFQGNNFLDFLIFAEDNGKISSKIQSLIKLNHFNNYGNQNKLLEIYKEFTTGIYKYTSKLSDKSKEKRLKELRDIWTWAEEKEFAIWDQIKNEVSVIGEPFSIYPVNEFYGFVKEIDTKQYHPKIKFYKLSTGEERELKVKLDIFKEHNFKVGDIIFIKKIDKVYKKTKDGETGKWIQTDSFELFLFSYYIMKQSDKFIKAGEKDK